MFYGSRTKPFSCLYNGIEKSLVNMKVLDLFINDTEDILKIISKQLSKSYKCLCKER